MRVCGYQGVKRADIRSAGDAGDASPGRGRLNATIRNEYRTSNKECRILKCMPGAVGSGLFAAAGDGAEEP